MTEKELGHLERMAKAGVTEKDGTLALITEVRRLRQALQAIDRAVAVEGPVPVHHRTVMQRHRAEWPTLWKAVDAARKALEAR